MILSVVPREPCRCARTSFRHYYEHKTILVLFSSCATLPHPPGLLCVHAIRLIVSIMIKNIIAEINGCGHNGGVVEISAHAPNMSRFSDSQT